MGLELHRSTPPRLGRPIVAGTTHLALPGVAVSSNGTAAQAANFVRYFPYYAITPIVIDRLVCETTAAAAAGKLLRMGIYAADKNYVPGALLADSGSQAADAAPAVINVDITPVTVHGLFFLAWNTDGAPSVRTIRGSLANGLLMATLGASPLVIALRGTQTFGAFPATGTAIDVISGSTIGLDYWVFPRISAP